MTETKNKYNSNKNLMIYKNQIGNKETKKKSRIRSYEHTINLLIEKNNEKI